LRSKKSASASRLILSPDVLSLAKSRYQQARLRNLSASVMALAFSELRSGHINRFYAKGRAPLLIRINSSAAALAVVAFLPRLIWIKAASCGARHTHPDTLTGVPDVAL
jgi:hypothetical protein